MLKLLFDRIRELDRLRSICDVQKHIAHMIHHPAAPGREKRHLIAHNRFADEYNRLGFPMMKPIKRLESLFDENGKRY